MAKKLNTPSITAVETALNAVAAQAPVVAPINPQTGLVVGSRKAANAKAAQIAAAAEAQAKNEAAPVVAQAAAAPSSDVNALINALPQAVRDQLLALVGGGSATVAPVATTPKVVTPKALAPEKDPAMPEFWKRKIKAQEFVSWIASGYNTEHGFWEREIFVMTTTPVYDDGTEENFRLCMASGVSLGTAANIVDALRMAADLIEMTPVWTYPGKPALKEAKTAPQVVTTDVSPVDSKTGRTAQQDALIKSAAAKRGKK